MAFINSSFIILQCYLGWSLSRARKFYFMSLPLKIDKTRADQDAVTFTPALRKYMDDKTTAEAVTI